MAEKVYNMDEAGVMLSLLGTRQSSCGKRRHVKLSWRARQANDCDSHRMHRCGW